MDEQSSNVVRIHGRAVLGAARLVDESVVEVLERWLDLARHGEVAAIVLGIVTNEGDGNDIRIDWAAGTAPANLMLAASSAAEARIKGVWLGMKSDG